MDALKEELAVGMEQAVHYGNRSRGGITPHCSGSLLSHVFPSYFATLSSHLTIESITIMEAPVAPTNTNQQAQIGTVV